MRAEETDSVEGVLVENIDGFYLDHEFEHIGYEPHIDILRIGLIV